MKNLILLCFISHCCLGQITTTESFSEKRWILNSNINIPATKFHFAKLPEHESPAGYVEFFSSFGIGLSLNYGKAIFTRDPENDKIISNKTKFYNLIGLQLGLLYSSKVATESNYNVNAFSMYGGINILDLQVGMGYELGARIPNTTGWFLSISYGIPIYELTGQGSYIIPQKRKIPKTEIELVGL